jgi:hypothetical protein
VGGVSHPVKVPELIAVELVPFHPVSLKHAGGELFEHAVEIVETLEVPIGLFPGSQKSVLRET